MSASKTLLKSTWESGGTGRLCMAVFEAEGSGRLGVTRVNVSLGRLKEALGRAVSRRLAYMNVAAPVTRATWGRARQDDPGYEYVPVSHARSLEGPGAGAGIVREPRLAGSTPAM